MARDVSIVYSAKDNFTTALTKMRNANAQFKTDLGGLQQKLDVLSQTKFSLQVASDKAREELKAAKKAFTELEDEANKTRLEEANKAFDNTQRHLKIVNTEAKETEKAILSLNEQNRRIQNQPKARYESTLDALAKAGMTKIVGDTVSQMANTMVGSMFGSQAGTLFSSALSGAASGAAMGSLAGEPVVGAVIGGAVGIANGAIQNLQKKDEAYKSYIEAAYNNANETESSNLKSGMGIASTREMDLLSFKTLMSGDASAATTLQSQLIDIGRNPNLTYTTAADLAKTMLGLGNSTKTILSRINSLKEAATALNLSDSDISSISELLDAAEESGTIEARMLKTLSKKGINAYAAVSETFGINQNDIADEIKNLNVDKVIDAIYQYMARQFGEASMAASESFAYKSYVEQSYENAQTTAQGKGYENTRKQGLDWENSAYSGPLGDAMKELNSISGTSQAYLDNLKSKYQIEGSSAFLLGTAAYDFSDASQKRLEEIHTEYQSYLQQMQNGDTSASVKIDALKSEYQTIVDNEYKMSSGVQDKLDSQVSLLQNIRENTANTAAYLNDYRLNIEKSKGIAASPPDSVTGYVENEDGSYYLGGDLYDKNGNVLIWGSGGYAYGLDRVPQDGLYYLHEDERVQTASDARSDRAGGSESWNIYITGNSFGGDYGPQDVAREIVQEMNKAFMLLAPQ